MAFTLYSQTTNDTYSNYNDGNDWWFAFLLIPIATGAPTSIDMYLKATSAGTGDALYIRSEKSASSANFGSATGISWSASGIQTIALSGGSSITSGGTYYVIVHVTSGTNFPKFQLKNSDTGSTKQWKSASAGGDPTTVWNNYDPAFVISGITPAKNLTLLGVG